MSDIPPYKVGDELPPSQACDDTLKLLLTRRSTTADLMSGPGPSEAELRNIILAASRVPDHRRVVPFRFVVIKDEQRKQLGIALGAIFKENNPEAEQRAIDYEASRFLRAPIVLTVVAALDEGHKTPIWEQTLTVGAVCQNALIACNASGFAAQWLTEWYTFDGAFKEKLGVSEDEKIAAFIYIGSATQNPKERLRPDIDSLISTYGSDLTSP